MRHSASNRTRTFLKYKLYLYYITFKKLINWCSILELVRTHFAACGGEEIPPRKFGKAAEPHRSKPQKNPEKNIGSNHILRNREFVFTPKIEYKLVAERSEANQNSLTFPFWCSILELVRTHFAACGGEENPPRNSENAAEPRR